MSRMTHDNADSLARAIATKVFRGLFENISATLFAVHNIHVLAECGLLYSSGEFGGAR